MRSWRIKNCGAVSETMDSGSVDKTMEDQVDLTVEQWTITWRIR